jgi:hypothetical protein
MTRRACSREANSEGQSTQIVAHQRDIGRFQAPRQVPAPAHGDADGRMRERRRVVHPVADHRDRSSAASLLDGRDLVFRQQAGAARDPRRPLHPLHCRTPALSPVSITMRGMPTARSATRVSRAFARGSIGQTQHAEKLRHVSDATARSSCCARSLPVAPPPRAGSPQVTAPPPPRTAARRPNLHRRLPPTDARTPRAVMGPSARPPPGERESPAPPPRARPPSCEGCWERCSTAARVRAAGYLLGDPVGRDEIRDGGAPRPSTYPSCPARARAVEPNDSRYWPPLINTPLRAAWAMPAEHRGRRPPSASAHGDAATSTAIARAKASAHVSNPSEWRDDDQEHVPDQHHRLRTRGRTAR